MDPVALTVGLCWTLAGLLCVALSISLIRGRVRRNAFYGVRFPESFASDDAWLAINRFGGKRLAAWSPALVLTGVACFLLPLRQHTSLTLTLGFAPLIFLLIPAWQSWRFARRYGRGA